MQVPSIYDGSQLHQTLHGKSFDDSDPFAHIAKLTNRSRGLPENNLLKSFSADKERANNVAKIKVVVCLLDTVSMLLLVFTAWQMGNFEPFNKLHCQLYQSSAGGCRLWML